MQPHYQLCQKRQGPYLKCRQPRRKRSNCLAGPPPPHVRASSCSPWQGMWCRGSRAACGHCRHMCAWASLRASCAGANVEGWHAGWGGTVPGWGVMAACGLHGPPRPPRQVWAAWLGKPRVMFGPAPLVLMCGTARSGAAWGAAIRMGTAGPAPRCRDTACMPPVPAAPPLPTCALCVGPQEVCAAPSPAPAVRAGTPLTMTAQAHVPRHAMAGGCGTACTAKLGAART